VPNDATKRNKTVLQTGAIKFRTSITIDVFFLTQTTETSSVFCAFYSSGTNNNAAKIRVRGRRRKRRKKLLFTHPTNFFFLKKSELSVFFVAVCVRVSLMKREMRFFFAGSEREREKRERARARKKKKTREICCFFVSCRVNNARTKCRGGDDAQI